MSQPGVTNDETLSRHDLRLITESYLSVQAATGEIVAYLRELVAPSDGTSAEIVEMLTPSAIEDTRTLQVAVGKFIDIVESLEHYTQLYGDVNERARQRSRALELLGNIAVFVERMSVKHRTRRYDDGVALAVADANTVGSRARELDALVRCVAESFGYHDGTTLADDDASSSEDSDYAPEHDDDSGKGLLESDIDTSDHDDDDDDDDGDDDVEDDQDEPDSKRAKTDDP